MNNKKKVPNLRAMEKMMKNIVSPMDEPRKKSKRENDLHKAQDIAWTAWDTPEPEKRIKLSYEALSISLDCADAYAILGHESRDILEALVMFRNGLEAGERALGKKVFEEDAGHFWGILKTRPYMRARAGVAKCLWDIGQHDDAIAHYKAMLRLNPGDNQGNRYMLAACFATLKRYDELEALFAQQGDDCGLAWLFTKALVKFAREGATNSAHQLLSTALDRNRFVPHYLSGKKLMPKYLPDSYGFGSDDEAICYVTDFKKAWEVVSGAIDWIVEVSRKPASS